MTEIKELNTFSELNPDEFIRGEALENVEERCLEQCLAYIGGSWKNAKTVDDIEVTRITGGITNQLYRVQLKSHVLRSGNEIYPEDPTDVAVKFYMPKHWQTSLQDGDDERLNDTIIMTLLSVTGIGPKVFGIWTGGEIQLYHEHEMFGPEHQQNPKTLQALASTLARTHHLEVPIAKNSEHWQFDQTERMLNEAYSNVQITELANTLDLALLKKRDVREELHELRSVFIREFSGRPTVFSHNDFLASNIMVTKPDEQVLLVDFEYAAYGSRGYDIATFLCQWGIDPRDYSKLNMRSDEVLEHFIKLYIEACEQLLPGYSDKPENSLREIMIETKLCTLRYFMFFVAFYANARESIIPTIEFDVNSNLQMVEGIYSLYFSVKERLIQDGTFKLDN